VFLRAEYVAKIAADLDRCMYIRDSRRSLYPCFSIADLEHLFWFGVSYSCCLEDKIEIRESRKRRH
jgi:hypothetical protein